MEWINGFLARLTKYEWLNRLLPGVFFVLLGKALKCPMLSPDNWVESLGVYILWGEVSSRVGALVVEPLLKAARVVRFADYSDYQDYQKANKEYCDMLLTNVNFARTLCALGLLLLVVRLFVLLPSCRHFVCETFGWRDIALYVWTTLFLFAYCWQVNFFVERIDKFKKDRGAKG